MAIWDDSECETFYADGRVSTIEACVVRVGNGQIVVDANSSSGGWMYEGDEVGSDHYRLTSPQGGKATLHRHPDDEVLDGSWQERGAYGMWRITLDKTDG